MENQIKWTAAANRAVWFAALVGVATVGQLLARKAGLYDLTAHEVEGLNTIILLVGSIYSVMFAFVIFVIWGQFTDVEAFTMRECNTLNDLARFSFHLNQDAGRAIRGAIDDYTQGVVKHEWKALAARRRDRQTEKSFSELMKIVIEFQPTTPNETLLHGRLIDIARKSGEHRDERVAKSLTRVPATLERLVSTMAGALLALVFIYPFHHAAAGVACFALVALVLFLARLVMDDTDNPFEGVCNVSPQPFAELTKG
jgi:hypothetical protein